VFFLLEKLMAMHCGEEGYKEAKKEFKRRESQRKAQKYRSQRRR
jgi:hypothetical protein